MPENTPPTGAPATGATGQQPGATGNAGGLISQGPNDPINPPATGGQQQDPATGEGSTDQQTPEQRELANARAANARMAIERDEARRLLQEAQRSALPPEEQTRLKSLDEQVKAQAVREKNLILRYEIAARAPKLGIVDPELAVLLLERSTKVTVNDDSTVEGLDEALKELIKEKPHLVRATTQPIDGGAGSGGSRTGGKPSMNDIIRQGARGATIKQG